MHLSTCGLRDLDYINLIYINIGGDKGFFYDYSILTRFRGASKHWDEIWSRVLFPEHIYYLEEFEIIRWFSYHYEIFDQLGILCLMFFSDMVCDQLWVPCGFETQSANLYGDVHTSDESFILNLIVVDFELKTHGFL